MTLAELLFDLRRRRIVLTVRDGVLTYRAPRGALTETDRDALRAHRDALVMLLRDVESMEHDGLAGTIRHFYALLTLHERARLAAEAATGDPIALRVALCLPEPLPTPEMPAAEVHLDA